MFKKKKCSKTCVKSQQEKLYLGVWGVTIITDIGNTMMKFCSVGDRLDLTPNIARASGTLQPKNRVVVRRYKIRKNLRGMGNSGKAHLIDVLLKMDQGDQISPGRLCKIRNLIRYQCDQILKRESEWGWRILTKVT